MFSFLKKKTTEPETVEMKAYASGEVIPIEDVKDPVFSSKAIGGGLAIEPDCGVITAPCDGTISVAMEDTKHAVGLTLDNGAEILLHAGLDTVQMKGSGFELYVKQGQKVRAGEKLLEFDLKQVEEHGFGKTCVLVFTNENQFPDLKYFTGMKATQNETVIVRC